MQVMTIYQDFHCLNPAQFKRTTDRTTELICCCGWKCDSGRFERRILRHSGLSVSWPSACCLYSAALGMCLCVCVCACTLHNRSLRRPDANTLSVFSSRFFTGVSICDLYCCCMCVPGFSLNAPIQLLCSQLLMLSSAPVGGG